MMMGVLSATFESCKSTAVRRLASHMCLRVNSISEAENVEYYGCSKAVYDELRTAWSITDAATRTFTEYYVSHAWEQPTDDKTSRAAYGECYR
jgi:hypothetical protein